MEILAAIFGPKGKLCTTEILRVTKIHLQDRKIYSAFSMYCEISTEEDV